MVTPKGRIAVAGFDSSVIEEACKLIGRHGYACLNAVNPEQVSAALHEGLADVAVVVGSGAREFANQLALNNPGEDWMDCIVVLDVESHGFPAPEGSNGHDRPGVAVTEEGIVSHIAERIALRRLHTRLLDTNRLLEAWKSDIAGWGGLSVLGPFAGKTQSNAFGIVRSMVSIHDQLKDITSSLNSQPPFSGRCREHQCAVYVELLQAIRHTIEILRKTKQSFKSKELGELRSYLEALLTEHS